MRFLLFVSAFLFPIVCLSQGLFDDAELSDQELIDIASQRASAIEALKNIEELTMLMLIQQLVNGDCTPAIEIDNSARSGDAEKQWLLSDLYRQGICFPQNERMAFQWVSRAAEQGHSDAQFDTGVFLLDGIGTTRDPEAAVSWLKQSSEQGNTKAQNKLGSLYRDGEAVIQNFEESLRWYRLAYDSGDIDACSNIGRLLINMATTDDEYARAMDVFIDGAELGSVLCQTFAGVALGDSNLTEDLIASHKWTNIALQGGNEQFKDILTETRDSVAQKLTPEQLSQAQQAASNWTPALPSQDTLKSGESLSTKLPSIELESGFSTLSPEDAKAKLVALGVPVTRDAFLRAASSNNLPIFVLFHKAGADLETSAITTPGMTPLYLSVDYNAPDIFNYLVDNGANIDAVSVRTGMTPLVRALAHENAYMTNKLIGLGADASAQPESVDTLLSATALSYSLFEDGNGDLIRNLLKLGGSVDETYSFGNTPLHLAASMGSAENVRVLLEAGSPINKVNELGESALLKAFSAEDPSLINYEVVNLLLRYGADPQIVSKYSMTPLFYASRLGRSDLIKLLVEAGANPNERFQLRQSEIPLNMISKLERTIVSNGGTPLLLAVALGNPGAIQALIDAGANLDQTINTADGELNLDVIADSAGTKSILDATRP
jgi:ankyrin repeat protein/TPR repeat protein